MCKSTNCCVCVAPKYLVMPASLPHSQPTPDRVPDMSRGASMSLIRVAVAVLEIWSFSSNSRVVSTRWSSSFSTGCFNHFSIEWRSFSTQTDIVVDIFEVDGERVDSFLPTLYCASSHYHSQGGGGDRFKKYGVTKSGSLGCDPLRSSHSEQTPTSLTSLISLLFLH